MSRCVIGVVLVALALAGRLRAQSADAAAGSPFRPLALPAPSDVRTGSGRPGTGYWQLVRRMLARPRR